MWTGLILLTEKRHSVIGLIIRKSNFAKINTDELFKAVDKDHNQEIDLDEWMSFWHAVKDAGHSEEEILEELELLNEGQGWVCFNDVKTATHLN